MGTMKENSYAWYKIAANERVSVHSRVILQVALYGLTLPRKDRLRNS